MLSGVRRLGVAVSGGADSVCLLHVLLELAPVHGFDLTVLHLDHNLRGDESRADAGFVRTLAASLGIPAEIRSAALAPGNLEQAGRDARLAFFRERIAAGAVDRVALGHTRRDQAETVLFRFLRGAGTAGLAGIRPVTAEGIVRPLLETGRDEIEAWLRARGIAWREDSTNASPAFARNRLRHELLPQLAREWNPRIEETLAQTAEWARDEEKYWDRELDRLDAGSLLDVTVLRALPAAAARRLIRRAIEHAKGNLRAIGFEHVEKVLELAQSPRGSGAAALPGLEARRSFGRIRLAEPGAGEPYAFPLPRPLPHGFLLATPTPISVQLLEKPETSRLSESVYNGEMGCLDWGRVPDSAVLRNWNPGDRFQPIGSSGPRKLKTFFQWARIPSWERAQWPVLADGSMVLWTRRFGAAAVAAATDSTRMILRISESGSDGRASNT